MTTNPNTNCFPGFFPTGVTNQPYGNWNGPAYPTNGFGGFPGFTPWTANSFGFNPYTGGAPFNGPTAFTPWTTFPFGNNTNGYNGPNFGGPTFGFNPWTGGWNTATGYGFGGQPTYGYPVTGNFGYPVFGTPTGTPWSPVFNTPFGGFVGGPVFQAPWITGFNPGNPGANKYPSYAERNAVGPCGTTARDAA